MAACCKVLTNVQEGEGHIPQRDQHQQHIRDEPAHQNGDKAL